jgi:hypothetical protein
VESYRLEIKRSAAKEISDLRKADCQRVVAKIQLLASNAGEFIINGCHRFLSQALNGEHIGLEAIDDGIWNIIYYTTLLGRLDEHIGKVTGASYRSEKCK